MDELIQIYERISFLRSKGVKMKDIAEHTQLAPSVLSALFTTVLPAYAENREKGMDDRRIAGQGTGMGKQCLEEKNCPAPFIT